MQRRSQFTPDIGLILIQGYVGGCVPFVAKKHSEPTHPAHYGVVF